MGKKEQATTTETVAVAKGPAAAGPLMLPANLGALAKMCAKDSTRYAMNGVKVIARPDGGYRAVATDSKRLAMVEGTAAGLAADYPDVPALGSAPNGATSALVPAKAWAEAFRAVPKPSKVGCKPILSTAAVVLGDVQTTFVSTDLETVNVLQPRNLAGRFPPFDEILPKTDKALKVAFDAKLLAELLQVAVQFAGEGTTKVVMEILDPSKPVVIRAENGSQRFTGMVMPLT